MAKPREEREVQIDDLYGLPLDEFTPARDDLAKRLRGDDRDAADAVKRLRKPSVSAWALNQVRRAERDRADALLEAGRRLREGQERLLAGQGRDELDMAGEEERRLVAELAGLAERHLETAGRGVSGAVRERLRATLHAVASDPEAQEGFERGRLVRDHQASGLGGLLGAPPAAGRSAGAPPKRGKPAAKVADRAQARRARRLEERLAKARSRRTELEHERTEAARRLRTARTEAARAAAQLEQAELHDEQARAKLDEAHTTLAELEEEATELQPPDS
jgi:hypothetical protein